MAFYVKMFDWTWNKIKDFNLDSKSFSVKHGIIYKKIHTYLYAIGKSLSTADIYTKSIDACHAFSHRLLSLNHHQLTHILTLLNYSTIAT